MEESKPFKCAICDEHVKINKTNKEDPYLSLGQKGIKSLTDKSVKLKDNKWRKWYKIISLNVHKGCLNSYCLKDIPFSSRCNQLLLSQPGTSDNLDVDMLEEEKDDFNFEEHCFLCGKKWNSDAGFTVDRSFMNRKLLTMIEELKENDELKKRVNGISSLIDVNARYHQKCYELIFVMVPDENDKFQEKFDQVCKYLEAHKGEAVPLSSLKNIMKEYFTEARLLQRLLKKKYGDDFHVWSQHGKESIYYYKRNQLFNSCSDWMVDDSELGEEQQALVLSTAAGILRKKIIDKKYEHNSYNLPSKFFATANDDIPNELSKFLMKLLYPDQETIRHKNKLVYIAQSIIRLIKPKSFISHLQLAVSTYILRKTGSKFLINMLSNLGICSSYYDTTLFESSCVMNPPKINTGNSFIQFVYNITDHKTQTSNTQNTFQCLGGVAVYTSENEVINEGKIKKCKTIPTEQQLASFSTMNISYLPTSFMDGLSKIKFIDTDRFVFETPDPLPSSYCAFLWGHYYGIDNLQSWKEYIEILSRKNSYSVPQVISLPFIKLKPTEPTTIYTAIVHAMNETKKKNQKICLITFDQPLYIKARNIKEGMIDTDGMKNVVILLEMFHLIVSYLSTIGYLMSGSGLSDMFELIYTKKAVKHLLAGHIFVQAMSAHSLAFIAIGKIICESSLQNEQDLKKQILNFFKDWKNNPPVMDDCQINSSIQKSRKIFLKKLKIFKTNGPTAALWIQYFESLIILFQFYEALLLGNWDLLLQCIHQMLPFFHAANHFSYGISAQIFLQDMDNLQSTMNPEEYDKFTTDVMLNIRRTNKVFVGMWCGVNDDGFVRHLNSMASSFDVMNALENFVGIDKERGAQSKNVTCSRLNTDQKSIEKFVTWLNIHKPFIQRNILMSLSTGVIGNEDINCYIAVAKGKEIMNKIIGQNAEEVKPSDEDRVKTLSNAISNSLHQTNDITTVVDHMILFKKISKFLQLNNELSHNALQYELTPYPPALFDKDGFMRKPENYELYEAINTATNVIPSTDNVSNDSVIIIDGEFLLHNVIWSHGQTYKQICDSYLSYLKKTYKSQFNDKNLHIIFDDNNNKNVSVKSYEQNKIKDKNIPINIDFNLETLATFTQECFLSNIVNKQKFIEMLENHLKNQVNIIKVTGNTDYYIIQTTLEIKKNTTKPLTFISNDTNLFVLLIVNIPENDDTIYFQYISATKKENETFKISLYKKLQSTILFLHAFSGCNLTSAPFGMDKKSIVNFIQQYPETNDIAQIFNNPQSTKDDIQLAAKKFIIKYYAIKYKINLEDDNEDECINKMRHTLFYGSNILENENQLNKLPPTVSVINQHAQRVFYQVQRWIGNDMDPVEWGWQKVGTKLMPIMMTEPPAPDALLKMHHCSCNMRCKHNCPWKKAGLSCSQYCKKCESDKCGNSDKSVIDESNNLEVIEYDELEANNDNDLYQEQFPNYHYSNQMDTTNTYQGDYVMQENIEVDFGYF